MIQSTLIFDENQLLYCVEKGRMSVEEYLRANIKPDVLKKTFEFQDSSDYKAIKTYTSSSRYQTARQQLKLRDKEIHKNILADIQRLQDWVLSAS